MPEPAARRHLLVDFTLTGSLREIGERRPQGGSHRILGDETAQVLSGQAQDHHIEGRERLNSGRGDAGRRAYPRRQCCRRRPSRRRSHPRVGGRCPGATRSGSSTGAWPVHGPSPFALLPWSCRRWRGLLPSLTTSSIAVAFVSRPWASWATSGHSVWDPAARVPTRRGAHWSGDRRSTSVPNEQERHPSPPWPSAPGPCCGVGPHGRAWADRRPEAQWPPPLHPTPHRPCTTLPPPPTRPRRPAGRHADESDGGPSAPGKPRCDVISSAGHADRPGRRPSARSAPPSLPAHGGLPRGTTTGGRPPSWRPTSAANRTPD